MGTYKHLYRWESERLVKLSDLNKISITQKPVRKTTGFQKKNVLLTQSGISVDKNNTAIFINKGFDMVEKFKC